MKDTDKTKKQLIAELEQLRQMHQSCEIKLQKVTQAEKILQDIIDYNPLSIQIVDSLGRNILTNASFTRLFGAEPGPDFCLFTDSQLIEAGLEYQLQWLKSGETVEFRENLYNPHKLNAAYPDVDVYTSGVGFPVFGEDGKPERFVINLQDDTDRVKAKMELENLNEQLRLMTAYYEQVREDERKKLARELHDDAGTALNAIHLKLELLKKKLKQTDALEAISHIISVVKGTITSVQSMVSDLRSVMIEDLGISAAVRSYAEEFAASNKIKVYLNIDRDIELNYEASFVVYKIMQSALSNVERHSEADTVDIWLNHIDDRLEFIVSDNGIGITAAQMQSNHSFGIIGMRERALTVGGTIEICPGADRGTIITFSLPLLNKEL